MLASECTFGRREAVLESPAECEVLQVGRPVRSSPRRRLYSSAAAMLHIGAALYALQL